MNHKTVLAAALAAAFAAAFATSPAQAQTAKDFEDMRAEIKRLRDEVNELKKAKTAEAKPADASGWGDRIEALEIKAKDAVVVGDIGGGFRIPGSETSLRIYGYAEGHVIHDLKASGSSDNFTDPTFQALDGSGAQTGRTKLTAQTSRFGFETATPTSSAFAAAQSSCRFRTVGRKQREQHLMSRGVITRIYGGRCWLTVFEGSHRQPPRTMRSGSGSMN